MCKVLRGTKHRSLPSGCCFVLTSSKPSNPREAAALVNRPWNRPCGSSDFNRLLGSPTSAAKTAVFATPAVPKRILGPLKKRAKNCPFLGTCGVKSRGSGGAPPPHLILLRNQRTRRSRARVRRSRRRRGRPGPTRPHPTRPPGGGGGGWWWLVGHATRESGNRVPPCGGKCSTPIAQAPSASSLRSSARASGDPVDPAIASTSMSPGAMRSRYRSSVAHVLTCFDQLSISCSVTATVTHVPYPRSPHEYLRS